MSRRTVVNVGGGGGGGDGERAGAFDDLGLTEECGFDEELA